MKRRAGVVLIAIFCLWSTPALAWDPFREDCGYELPEPAREPDPAPFIAPPQGIYYVTDTYVADVVTTSGPITTYTTSTLHESTGSYARVIDEVGTGAPSVFDGTAFNGRRVLGDGRSVAGTYYENFVLADSGFVPVSIVFFQDDAEIARLLGASPPPRPITSPAPPLPSPITPTGRPVSPPCCTSEHATAPVPSPMPTAPPPIRPVVSVLPMSAPLASLEVLRGRPVALSLRAFVDDREVPVRSWTVIAGDAGDAVASSGPGTVPFRSSWRLLAPAGSAYELVFRIDVDTPETGHRTVDSRISVVVRSPALER